MIYFFLQYILNIIYYFFIHIILLYFIFNTDIQRELVYKKDILLSYNLIVQYEKIFIQEESFLYTEYNKKNITIIHPCPLIKINNIIFWNNRIGLFENDYIADKTKKEYYPHIISKIPIYMLNEYIIDEICNIFHTIKKNYKIDPEIVILNKFSIQYCIENKIKIIRIDDNKIIKNNIGK